MAESKSGSFETSLSRLELIVKELEGEGVELQRSVELYNEGRVLVARCEELLRDAEATLKAADKPPANGSDRGGADGDLDADAPF